MLYVARLETNQFVSLRQKEYQAKGSRAYPKVGSIFRPHETHDKGWLISFDRALPVCKCKARVKEGELLIRDSSTGRPGRPMVDRELSYIPVGTASGLVADAEEDESGQVLCTEYLYLCNRLGPGGLRRDSGGALHCIA